MLKNRPFVSVATTGPSVYYNQSPADTAANVTPTKAMEVFSCKHNMFHLTVKGKRINKLSFVYLCRAQYMG